MKRIISLTVSILLIVVALFTITSCQKSDCNTGWSVIQYKAEGDETAKDQSVLFSVTRDSGKVDAVWVNIGEMNVEEVVITMSCYYASDGTDISNTAKNVVITRDQVSKSDGGWISLLTGWQKSYSNVKLKVAGGVQINEVVFLDENGKHLSAKVSKADMMYKKDGKIIGGEFEASELEDEKFNGNTPLNLVDEQDKYDEKFGK